MGRHYKDELLALKKEVQKANKSFAKLKPIREFDSHYEVFSLRENRGITRKNYNLGVYSNTLFLERCETCWNSWEWAAVGNGNLERVK